MPTSQKKSKYDAESAQYYRDVHDYLTKVHNGRRVPRLDPRAPQFSQETEDARIAAKLGLKNQIRFGPPAPAFKDQPAAPLQAAPQPSFMDSVRGYVEQSPRYFQQGMDYLKGMVPSPQRDPNESYRGHGPKIGQVTDPVLPFVQKTMEDPRNAWMGFGPIGMAAKGWSGAGKGMGAWDEFAKGLRGLTSRESGGFAVPLEKKIKDVPYLEDFRRAHSPLFGGEAPVVPGPARGYLDHIESLDELGQGLQSPDIMKQLDTRRILEGMAPNARQDVRNTMLGQAELQGERSKAINAPYGGGVVPSWFKPKDY